MAVAQKVASIPARSVKAAPRARVVRVSAHKAGAEGLRAPLAAVALTAFTLLSSTPVEAGVVLQQPELKKVFQGESAPPPAPKPLPSPPPVAAKVEAKKQEAKKEEKKEEGEGGFSLDPRAVALPGAVAGVGGLFFAASKLDNGWNEFFAEAMVRDSNNYAGYEPLIKEGDVAVLGRGTKGTMKVKTQKKK